MSNIGTTDPGVECAKGNIDGCSFFPIQSGEDNTQTTLTDVWGGTGDLVYPTTAETLEISSSSANDTAAGTGSRTGLLFSLALDFTEQVTPFTMNGTTAVTLTGTHFRVQDVVLDTSGADGVNDGVVTLQVSGGGAVRSVANIGNSRSFDSHWTVPLGKSAVVLQSYTLFEKDYSGNTRAQARDAGTANSSWISNVPVPLYQNIVPFEVMAKPVLPEKTDFKVQALTTASGGSCVIIVEFELYDNSVAPLTAFTNNWFKS